MDQSTFRLGYLPIAQWVADDHPPSWSYSMNTHTHPSKHMADRVAAELHAIGWKTAVVPVSGQFEVRYFRPEIHGPHRRRGDQS